MKQSNRLILPSVFSLIFVFLLFAADAQTSDTASNKNLPNFLFPEFSKCVIKLKDGQMNSALVNYNLVDQEMVFEQEGTYMVLSNPQQVDTIFVSSRRFVPYEEYFLELILTGAGTLYIHHKATAEPAGTATAYGVRSQSASSRSYKQIYGPTGSVTLRVPDDFKIVDATEYIAEHNGVMKTFSNKKQFIKIFKDKEKELEEFIDTNHISFKKLSDIINLFNYCNQIYG